jgi:hypothetical protein
MKLTASLALWQQLTAAQLVDGDLPNEQNLSPWYIRVMQGFAGWLGALFLLCFVGISLWSGMAESALIVVGLFNCGVAWLIFQRIKHSEFMSQFALAVSFSGQMLFVIGLFLSLDFHEPSASIFCGIAVFEGILALLIPNFIHRVVSSFATLIALSLVVSYIDGDAFIPAMAAATFALIWLNEIRFAAHAHVLQPVGYGVAFALLSLMGSRLYYYDLRSLWGYGSYDDRVPMWLLTPWPCTVGITAVLAYVLYQLLQREQLILTSKTGVVALFGTLLLAVLSWWAPSIVIALMIVLVGFSAGNRVLLALGFVGLGLFLSHYYYSMLATLLTKSFVLAVSGITLLVARVALNRYFPPIIRDHHDA